MAISVSGNQVDRIAGLTGTLGAKAPCVTVSLSNIVLSGLQTVDGVALVANDRHLAVGQTDTTTNGIYDVSTGVWARSPDFNGVRDIVEGTLVFIARGTLNARSSWQLTTLAPVIGTSSLTFAPWPPGGGMQTLGVTGAWDLNKGGLAVITLTANVVMAAPSNIKPGAYGLIVKQDAVGSRTITWASVYKYPGGTAPVLSTAASSIDIISFISDGTNMYGVSQSAFA